MKVVNRYESTIAEFFGHSHKDHFIAFFDATRATNVGPSGTSYKNLNPGFRLYEVDGIYASSSYAVLNHHSYTD